MLVLSLCVCTDSDDSALTVIDFLTNTSRHVFACVTFAYSYGSPSSGGKSPEEVWSEHLEKESTLKAYASSMCALATGPWAKHGGGRIKWCVETCLEYFHGGKLERLVRKDIKRACHGNPTLLEHDLIPSDAEVGHIVTEFSNRQLCLLDVGSCYNPFAAEEKFSVTAIDIAPAVEVLVMKFVLSSCNFGCSFLVL